MKPANIKCGERGVLKVLDFGLAKVIDEVRPQQSGETTETGIVLGTPSYMSPEQAPSVDLFYQVFQSRTVPVDSR